MQTFQYITMHACKNVIIPNGISVLQVYIELMISQKVFLNFKLFEFHRYIHVIFYPTCSSHHHYYPLEQIKRF